MSYNEDGTVKFEIYVQVGGWGKPRTQKPFFAKVASSRNPVDAKSHLEAADKFSSYYPGVYDEGDTRLLVVGDNQAREVRMERQPPPPPPPPPTVKAVYA